MHRLRSSRRVGGFLGGEVNEELKRLTIIFLSSLTNASAVGMAVFTALGIGSLMLKYYLEGK